MPPSQSLAELADDFWDAKMRSRPLLATFSHYPRYHGLLEDNSPSGRQKTAETLRALLDRLKVIDRTRLSSDEDISRDVLEHQLELDIESPRHKFWEWEIDQVDGPQTLIATAVELAQPMKTEQDAEALLARLATLPAFFRNLVDNLKDGLASGRVAARTPTARVITQIEDQLASKPEATPFAEAANRLPDALKAKYRPRILQAVRDSVRPGYSIYLRFLKDEYLAKTRPDERPGLSYLPGGREAYGFRIRYRTSLDLPAEEIHRIGLEELRAIHAEMREVAKRMGHAGELRPFFDKVRLDPKNYYATREEVVQDAERLIAVIEAKLPRFFGRLPKTPIVVKPVESYKEKSSPGGQYYTPPDDLSRPGIFFVNTYEPKTRPRFGMASLTAHETLPGHHLQLALAVENRDLPLFRRHAPFTAYVEGWALYSERLADEMGLYSDDLARLGMLMEQAFRACRLVVDTGLHAEGWSRQKAIDAMLDGTPMAEAEVEAEIDRYIVWPGQALAYKIGQREISAIRSESQKKLGGTFDLRAFHDAVLKNGALPLPILRRTILG